MAEITIKLKDLPGNKWEMTLNPTVETLFKKFNSGEIPTSAEAFALKFARIALEESRNNDPTKILIPKVRGL